MTKHGQEIIVNDWQIAIQNLLRLVVFSMLIGVIAALLWWSLRAPQYSAYYFLLYWYSWFYCRFLGCSATGAYNLRILPPFIAQISAVFGTCKIIFAFTSIVAGFGLRYYFVLRGQKLSEERYLRGAKLLLPSELNAEIDAARDNNGKLKYVETPLDLWVGRERIRVPARMTYLHLVAAGVSGTGKTQMINSLLKQVEEKPRQKCLILDLNGQYYSRFGRPGDKIISLYDQRSEAWSFYNENVPPEFFAEALVELNEGSGNKFFSNAGRALMTDVISLNTNVQGVWRDLTTKPAELLPKLDGGISPGLLGAPEQAAGVIASASVEMNFLRHLNHWNRSEDFFSITDWVLSQDEDWVFLIVKDIDLAAVKPLMRLWFDLAVGGVLQREEKKDYPHLWIVCDELPGLGVLPSFGKLLSQGRKYKATLVAGYQVQGQIRHLYGKDQAEEIFSGLQNKFIFRTPDPNASKEESATLGEQDVEEISSGIQFGASPTSDRNSLNRAIKTRPVVMASELQNLPDLTAYVKLCEFNATRVRFDYQSYPELNEPSIREIPPTSKPEVSEPHEPLDDDSWSSEPAEIVDDDDHIKPDAPRLQWDIEPSEFNQKEN